MPTHRLDLPCRSHAMRAADLVAWVGCARPNDRIVYHQGLLVVDHGSTSPLQKRERRRIDDLATASHAAAVAGLVHLVQERIAAGRFRYVAVKAVQKSDIGGSRYQAEPAPLNGRSTREPVDEDSAGDRSYVEAPRAVPGSSP